MAQGSDSLALVALLAICSITLQGAIADTLLTDAQADLMDSLLTNYHSLIPPQKNENNTIKIYLGMGLISVENLDEDSGVLTSHFWMRLLWQDFRLTWDPNSNGGLTSLRIPYTKLWRPDILPYNSAADEFTISEEYNMVVYNDGSVLFTPHVRLKTTCFINIQAFPFDTQLCSIKFGSWVYSETVIKLGYYEGKKVLDMSDYIHNAKWDVDNHNLTINAVYYPCCSEGYESMTGLIKLRRRSHLLMRVYAGPAIILGLVVPVVFLLPAGSSHKMTFGGSVLISQVVVMAMFVNNLPDTHFAVPTLAMYLLANVVLLSLSLACAALVVYCWARADRGGTGVPVFIDKIFLGVVARCLCARQEQYVTHDRRESHGAKSTSGRDDVTDDTIQLKDYNRHGLPAEWRQLSAVLDRLLFILFLVVSVVTMLKLIKHAY